MHAQDTLRHCAKLRGLVRSDADAPDGFSSCSRNGASVRWTWEVWRRTLEHMFDRTGLTEEWIARARAQVRATLGEPSDRLSADELVDWVGSDVPAAAWPFDCDEVLELLESRRPDELVPAVLSRIEPDPLSHRQRTRMLRLLERHKRWTDSLMQTWLVAVAGPTAGTGRLAEIEEVAGEVEVGEALTVTDHVAAERIETARMLARRFRGAADALAAGQLSLDHARTLVQQTRDVDDEAAALVERVALRPQHRRKTVKEFRALVRKAAMEAEPLLAAHRAARARKSRHVRMWPLADGMAELAFVMPAVDAISCQRALDALARRTRLRDPQETRTLDELRVDSFADLLAGALADPSLPRVHRRPITVGVTIDLATLLGLAEHPGEIDGYGAIDAATARALAADGQWKLLVLDATTGCLRGLSSRTYTPSARVAEFVTLRDRTCRMPRCNRPAHLCDVDHVTPYDHSNPAAGGATDAENLELLCEHHHQGKHDGCVTVRRVGETLEWTTSAGFVYREPPPDLRPIRLDDRRDDTDDGTGGAEPPTDPQPPPELPCPF
jgi:hypothetical protein